MKKILFLLKDSSPLETNHIITITETYMYGHTPSG